MKPKHIVLVTITTLIIIIIRFIMTHWLVFSYGTVMMYGPLPILKLLHYECEERRIAFPQWINNDEICYMELVLHYDDYSNEKPPFFLKLPITDIYIYREKANQPETKKLIKHVARQNIEPHPFLEGSLDKSLGLRVYSNGKNIFLYYTYDSCRHPKMYRCITMNINGGNVKERIPKIIPFDISEDGEKLYGILEANTFPDVYAIEEYTIKTGKMRKIIDITDEKFRETRNARIKDLKLMLKDRLILSYEKDYNTPGIADYTYLIDASSNQIEFVCDPSKAYFDDHIPYYEDYMFASNQGTILTKDGQYLIFGVTGIYKKEGNNWIKTMPFFYKEYPAISPDGAKIAFIDILIKRGELNSLWFAGRQLKVMDLKNLITDTGVSQ